jgi:hypothetical protein
LNTLKLPRAYVDGLAAFWRKEEWCAVLIVKISAIQNRTFIPINLTIEKRGTWGDDCSVYPYLEP